MVLATERSRVHFFVSHSAGETSGAVLKALREALRDACHTVFDDSHIVPGTRWRSKIYHELARCDAAVLLLDRYSLRRRWVQREVDLLQWRRALNPQLEVIPVLLDRTRLSTVRDRGFGDLTETQFLQAGRLGLEPEAVARTIVDRFAKLRPAGDDAMDRWFGAIETALSRIGQAERQHKAAVALGVPPDEADAVTERDGCRFLAHQFMGRPTDQAIVAALRWLVDAADREAVSTLIELIGPVWVDGSAAMPLVSRHRPRRMVAVLNAKQSWTARQYVSRATCADPIVRTIEVAAIAGEEGAAGLRTQWEREVLFMLGADPDSGDTIAEVDSRVVRDGDGFPVYLVVNASRGNRIVAAEAIRMIQAQFRWLGVVLLVGGDLPSEIELAGWHLGDAQVLRPPLGTYAETDAQRTSRHLRYMLDRAPKGH